jgi:hypothetical protein
MTAIQALLARAKAAGITLRAEGNQLRLSAPAPPDPSLLHDLAAAKPELLALLTPKNETAPGRKISLGERPKERGEDVPAAALADLADDDLIDPANWDDADPQEPLVAPSPAPKTQRDSYKAKASVSHPDLEETGRRRQVGADILAGIAATDAADAIDPATFDNFDPPDVAERTARQLEAQTMKNQARWEAGRPRHAGADHHPSAPTTEAQQLKPPAATTEPPLPPPPDFDTLVARLAAALATPRPFQRLSGDPGRALAYFSARARHLLSTARGCEDQLTIVVREERLAAKCTTTNQRNKGNASDA